MDVPEVLGKFVAATVERVFSTMLSLKTSVTRIDDLATLTDDQLSEVTGSVSFAGAMTGVVYFSVHPGLSKVLTARIVGSNAFMENEENDVMGELTNMITGNIKTAMADKGFNSQLTIPTVVRGQAISLSCKGFTNALRVAFSVPELNEEFHVRIMVKLG